MHKRLDLTGEQYALRGFHVVEGFHPESIAGEGQHPGSRIVNADREHAPQLSGELVAMAGMKGQDDFAVRFRQIGVVGALGLLLQFDVVVYLGIGDDGCVIGVVDRLVAGRQIDDGEPAMAKGDSPALVDLCAVRPTSGDGRNHPLHDRLGLDCLVERVESSDAAHASVAPSFFRKCVVVGGPAGDCGLTGRKIIVDTYGGMARHGGGAFSGKDPSKVDRSAAYAGRYVAKNIVAAGLANKCEIQISYAIGVAEPTSISIDTFGTGKLPDETIEKLIREHFDLRPKGLIDMLDLKRPIYQQTAAYGHFGREEEDFTWEKTDKADALREAL